jgi:hypothetical protein
MVLVVRGLPIILLGAAALSQISSLIYYVTISGTNYGYIGSYFYVLGIAGVLVVSAVTWYVMSLQARALGGALVLGWVTIAALMTCLWVTWTWGFSTTWSVGHVCAVLSFVLMAIVVMLTIIYVRRPAELEAQRTNRTRSSNPIRASFMVWQSAPSKCGLSGSGSSRDRQ